jgi:hypothetical protein
MLIAIQSELLQQAQALFAVVSELAALAQGRPRWVDLELVMSGSCDRGVCSLLSVLEAVGGAAACLQQAAIVIFLDLGRDGWRGFCVQSCPTYSACTSCRICLYHVISRANCRRWPEGCPSWCTCTWGALDGDALQACACALSQQRQRSGGGSLPCLRVDVRSDCTQLMWPLSQQKALHPGVG